MSKCLNLAGVGRHRKILRRREKIQEDIIDWGGGDRLVQCAVEVCGKQSVFPFPPIPTVQF